MSSLDTQVGGDHYKSCPIQPIEYITKNKLSFIEGCVIKYVTRHRSKNGRQDILKAIHYLQLLLDLEYPEKPCRTLEEIIRDVPIVAYDPATKSASIAVIPPTNNRYTPGVYILNRRTQGGVTFENAVRYINTNGEIFTFQDGGLRRTGNLNSPAFHFTELTYTGFKTIAEYLSSISPPSEASVDIPSPSPA